MNSALIASFAAIFAITLAAVGIERVFQGMGNPRPHYTEFANAIQILESRISWVGTSSGLRIYVTGILTNQSGQAWHDLEFDCRFYDTGGAMIDAANASGRLTVLPNDDSAFRVSVPPARSSNDYASFKISVSNARNAKSWF